MNKYYDKNLKPHEIKIRDECLSAKDKKELLAVWSKYLFPEINIDSDGKRYKSKIKTALKTLCKVDRLFLDLYVEGYKPETVSMINNHWLFERIREEQRQRDKNLDLLPRGHFGFRRIYNENGKI